MVGVGRKRKDFVLYRVFSVWIYSTSDKKGNEMKTALYIEDGISQVILTPENDHEKNILKQINSKEIETTMKIGTFGLCAGGWVRYYRGSGNDLDIDSLMLTLKDKPK